MLLVVMVYHHVFDVIYMLTHPERGPGRGSCKDLFVLHYIFLPRIQEQLNVFRESYSHHRIRSEGNKSPYISSGMRECQYYQLIKPQ